MSFSSVKTTFFHSTVVLGSKLFSRCGSISPILHEEKKLVVQAVQKTCFEKFPQLSAFILCPRITRRSKLIGIHDGLQAEHWSTNFFAPLIGNFIQPSKLRLGDVELLIVWAILRLDTQDLIVLLFSFFVEAAQVTKALADSTFIGSSNLTRNVEQNSVYSFHAEQFFAQVCLEDDNSIRLLRSSHRE